MPDYQSLAPSSAAYAESTLVREVHSQESVCPHRTPPRMTQNAARNGCLDAVQEVSIMRKVRHKNVVQFIGACTRKPNLCIVVEYMPGGSVYDYMRRVSPSHLLVRMALCLVRVLALASSCVQRHV